MRYRHFHHEGDVLDRVDRTESDTFGTTDEVAIAEVAAALEVAPEAVTVSYSTTPVEPTATIPAPEEPPPPPDVNGFMLAAMAAFDADPVASLDRGNEVLARWPSFVRALDARNWGVARLTLGRALATATVTQGEYDALVALLAEHHIPEA